ncbi:MAG: hypothetical protein PHT07_21125 [Paludibacter sp.]|nr:hypothetical protein [Paludibacter sp.]
MRQRIHNEENKGITIQRAKVKVGEYPEQIIKDGKFNPICPAGYNFLTGYTDYREDTQRRGFTSSMSGRLNGRPVHNF